MLLDNFLLKIISLTKLFFKHSQFTLILIPLWLFKVNIFDQCKLLQKNIQSGEFLIVIGMFTFCFIETFPPNNTEIQLFEAKLLCKRQFQQTLFVFAFYKLTKKHQCYFLIEINSHISVDLIKQINFDWNNQLNYMT